MIQLLNEEKLTDERKLIIENLELLGNGNLKELQKKTNLKEDQLRENIRLINYLTQNLVPSTLMKIPISLTQTL